MAYKIKKKKLTRKKIAYFMKDEKKATEEYKKYGLPNLAKDEKKHYEFLKKLKEEKKFKKKTEEFDPIAEVYEVGTAFI